MPLLTLTSNSINSSTLTNSTLTNSTLTITNITSTSNIRTSSIRSILISQSCTLLQLPLLQCLPCPVGERPRPSLQWPLPCGPCRSAVAAPLDLQVVEADPRSLLGTLDASQPSPLSVRSRSQSMTSCPTSANTHKRSGRQSRTAMWISRSGVSSTAPAPMD